MVTEAEYEEWSKKTSRSLEFEEAVDEFNNNREHAYILRELAKVFKGIKTFKDLENLPTSKIENNVSKLAKVINRFPGDPGANLVIITLLSSHDLSYKILQKLFLELTGNPNEYSRTREKIANMLIKKLTKQHSDFLDIFNNSNVPYIDHAVLMLGLSKIINTENRARVLQILSDNIKDGQNLEFCIIAARKIEAVELKEDFELALEHNNDKYFTKKIQKLLSSSKWQ